MLTPRLNPAASHELDEAAHFYRDRAGPRLAALFVAEVERVLMLLCEFPQLGTPIEQGRRFFPLRRFPYSVFYRAHGDSLRVMAIVHHRRHPDIARRRH